MPRCARASVSLISPLVFAVRSSSSLILLTVGCVVLRMYFFDAHPTVKGSAPTTSGATTKMRLMGGNLLVSGGHFPLPNPVGACGHPPLEEQGSCQSS